MADRPGHPETHIILAEALVKAGQADEAVKVIEDAWEVFSRAALPDGVPDSTLVAVQLNLARWVFCHMNLFLKATLLITYMVTRRTYSVV